MKRHHNLPAPRVRLIGREQDLIAARRALLGTEGRLLTLTGTGGCGKTRLALALAAEVLPHFPDGVWLVELAAVAAPTRPDEGGSTTPGARLTPRRVDGASVLTARELQVAALLRHGLTNRQIAEQLVITERTVASHIEHILEKLGFASRHQVGAWVVEQGLLG
jgi:DNA-binding CsgD family transcriptional regulator